MALHGFGLLHVPHMFIRQCQAAPIEMRRTSHGLRLLPHQQAIQLHAAAVAFRALRVNILFLCHAGLLDALLQIQQLDRHDIEVMHPLYEHLRQHVGSADGVQSKYQASLQDRLKSLEHTALAHSYNQHLLEQSYAEQLTILREYLLAATAKDCSIMISMQPLPCNSCHAGLGPANIPGCQLTAKYRIAVVDLDMKSSGKIPGHFVLDRQLTDCH